MPDRRGRVRPDFCSTWPLLSPQARGSIHGVTARGWELARINDHGGVFVFRNVLFVCVGNICRSPTAARVMQHKLGDRGIDVASAGLRAMVDRSIDPMAAQLLADHGLDPAGHKARQLSADVVGQADLVLVMERRHQADMMRSLPQASGKTFLLGKWLDDLEIPDPYGQQLPAFEHVYGLIDRCVASWLPYIK